MRRRGTTARGGGAWLVALFALAGGCGLGGAGGGARGEHAHGSAHVGGKVISTVAGHPITVGDVTQLVRASGLTPDLALRRLQDERLLMAEAEERGYARDEAVQQVARQALVQALLVSTTDAAEVSDEQIRAAFDQTQARFEQPERRASVHVLALLPKQATPEAELAARERVAQMIGGLRDATDLDAFMSDARSRSTPQAPVVAERIPAVDRNASFVRPYLDALFSLSEPGVVAQPVRTIYGWHAIRVTEIIPAEKTPYDKAAEQLRAELLLQRKTQLVDELIGGARKQYGVEIPSAVGQTLAKLEP